VIFSANSKPEPEPGLRQQQPGLQSLDRSEKLNLRYSSWLRPEHTGTYSALRTYQLNLRGNFAERKGNWREEFERVEGYIVGLPSQSLRWIDADVAMPDKDIRAI